MRKNVSKILVIIGIIPFIISLSYSIYSSITGFSFLCGLNCTNDYGMSAFFDSILVFSYIFWPTYVIGVVLIMIWVLKKNRV